MAVLPDQELDELRQEVDRLDEAMVDLLAERMRVVAAIAAVKRAAVEGRPAIRPGREAVILRRLVQRADGRFPAGTLVRMWRELLAATTRAQAPFTVAVFVPSDQPQLWDIARDHFGSSTPIQRTESGSHALRLLADDAVQLAVLPVPGEHDVWWAGLLDTSIRPLRVVARLPFGYPEPCQEGAGSFVVGAIEPEPSGDDLSLIVIETVDEVSRGRLVDLLSGFAPRWLATRRYPGFGGALHLVELDGFPSSAEAGLEEALAGAGEQILRSVWLGSYARPLAGG